MGPSIARADDANFEVAVTPEVAGSIPVVAARSG